MGVPRREEVTVPSLRPPLGHYAQAVRFGNLLFVTGCTGVTADGQIVADDVAEQTRQVFRNLQVNSAVVGRSSRSVRRSTQPMPSPPEARCDASEAALA
jgi:2-iminobutanoate/2-iminopropanoate deaminase